MDKQKTSLGELKLVGLKLRTNNKNEMHAETAKIGEQASFYWQNQVANHIKHRVHPGVTYAVYTEYESDEHGDYSYFIGEVVDSFTDQDLTQFSTLTIPVSHYQKFTTQPGKIPDIVIAAWQNIWAMTERDLGGQRQYIADFEVFDQRAADPSRAVVDIYIGINE